MRFFLFVFAFCSVCSLGIVLPSQANNPWQEHRKLSKQHADKGEWRRACRQAVLAGAAMAKQDALTVDYMGKIGQRCTEAGR